jgi:hypothetical protein
MFKDVLIMLCSIAIVILTAILAFCFFMVLDSCTLSFTNISTHGSASDLVDEEQTASPDVKTDLSLPVIQ